MPTVAFRVTRKRRAFVNAPQVRKVLDATLDKEVKPHFIDEFDKVVSNWKHKPIFQGRKFVTADAIWVNIFPTGINKLIYTYVTKGTRPHVIRAKNVPYLVFMWGGPGSYKAKTGTGGTFGGPGIVVGGELTVRRQVNHPGNAARNFESVILKKEKQWYSRTMENAWRRAIRAMSK